MYKKFPLKKITNSKKFYLEYINEKNNLLKNINFNEIDRIINAIKNSIKKKKLSTHVVTVDLRHWQII